MHSTTTARRGLSTLIAVTIAGVCGCEAVDFLTELSDLTPFTIVGEDEERVLFVVSKTAQGIYRGGDGRLPDDLMSDVYSLDLSTLEAELVITEIAAGGIKTVKILANGRWVAWIDREEDVVKVVDRQTGDQRRYFEQPGSAEALPSLVRLQDDRLVAFERLNHSLIPFADTYQFIVLDLETGEEARIGDAWLYATHAMSADYFALMNNQTTEVNAIGLELTTNLDVVDLTTGERRTIAPNIRVSGGGGALFISGNELIWQQFKDGKFRTKLESYNLESGERRTIANPFEADGLDAWVRDVAGDRMLVKVTSDDSFLIGEAAYEIRTLDGETTPIVTFPVGLLNRQSYWPQPRLVGEFVVWSDTQTADLMIWNPQTKSVRRFDPTHDLATD